MTESPSGPSEPSGPAPWRRRGEISRPLPLLGPPWAEALLRFSVAQLRAACTARGLRVSAYATRLELAQQLTHDKFRAQAEEEYRAGQIPFPSHEREYTFIAEQIARLGLRNLVDLGCGPGLFSEHVLRPGMLPADGSYLGVDNVTGALELARSRCAGDARARFELCDLNAGLPKVSGVDGVLLSFVISYLDTRTADRLLRRAARAWPAATLMVALSVPTSINGPEEAPPLERVERFLDGDPHALEGWRTARFLAYTRVVDEAFGIVEEHRWQGTTRLLWIAGRAPQVR